MMKTYLVGGAVRDLVLGNISKDNDYVVVGATPQDMLDLGYSQVGANFPVFLHPDTGDEYALARREKKEGEGYLGFAVNFSTDVTLEEDLERRDLTINAIALDEATGEYVDPFGGVRDAKDGILRHTSAAFEEDPVRVLRIARFRARFGDAWVVAQETKQLVYRMSKRGVLSELNGERIWKEMARALMEPYARLFFDTLYEMDALHKIFPEIYALKRALQPMVWHPEGDAYEHTMLVLQEAVNRGLSLDLRYAALVHDIGKGITPESELPAHIGHETKGVRIVEEFSNRNSVPAAIRDLAKVLTRYHMHMHKLDVLNAKTFVRMFDSMGAYNSPYRVQALINLSVCDAAGRLGYAGTEYPDKWNLLKVWKVCSAVKFADVFPNGASGKSGSAIGDRMNSARIKAVSAKLKEMRG